MLTIIITITITITTTRTTSLIIVIIIAQRTNQQKSGRSVHKGRNPKIKTRQG